jgi:uroporphyrinogen decarboxylase
MMTPKERVLAAIHHLEPDRVPIGEWQFGPEVTGPLLGEEPVAFAGLASAQAYWAGRRDLVIGQWKRVLTALALKFNWDALLLHLVIGKDTPIEVPDPIDDHTWRMRNGDTLSYSKGNGPAIYHSQSQSASARASAVAG